MMLLLLSLNLAAQFLLAKTEIGLIQIKSNPNEDAIEICSSYSSEFNPFPIVSPSTLPWDQWHQVIDIYPNMSCESTEQDYAEKFVFVKRGNCTFTTKALNVIKSRGIGTIIVSDEGLLIPFVNDSLKDIMNITLSIISSQSYNVFLSAKHKHGIENLRIIAYAPEQGSRFDISSIAIWCIAVATLAYGAWNQGARLKKDNRTTVVKQSGKVVSGSRSETSDILVESSNISITPIAAVIFFCASSGFLLLLYYFFDYTIYLIIAAFCLAGSLSLFDLLVSQFEMSPCFIRYRILANNIPLLKNRPPILSIMLFVACFAFSISWAILRNEDFAWIFQDILGAAFCIYVIKTITLQSFKISTILLMLFFIYDIFYVFITPFLTKDHKSIMVQVATGELSKSNEELPMLFKLPKYYPLPTAKCFKRSYSLLGYGDIILPGLHVGFCASLDVMRCRYQSIKRYTYYISALIGYCVGLVFTMIALYVMMKGQPALLYLVPCCLTSTLLVAVKRGELKQVWNGKLNNESPQPSSGVPQEEAQSLLELTENR